MKYVIIYLCLLFLTSCQRDNLYYATNSRAVIRVNVDWLPAQLSPNGITIIAYNSDGSLFESFSPFSNPNTANIMLPAGSYNLILYNNSSSEYKSIGFRGIDNIYTSEVYSVKTDSKNDFIGVSVNTVSNPDTLAVSRVVDLDITPSMVQYYKDRPAANNPYVTKEITVVPQRVTSVAEIKAHVKGLCYSSGAPRCFLRNMSGSYFMWENKNSSYNIVQEFILNNRQFDIGSTTDGTLSKQISTFGLHSESDGQTRYYLDLYFMLINGESYPLSMDITDKISIDQRVYKRIKINIEIELPEVIGGNDHHGAFNPNVNEWENIEVKFPI